MDQQKQMRGQVKANSRNKIKAKGMDERMGDKRLRERGTQQAARGARSKEKRATR